MCFELKELLKKEGIVELDEDIRGLSSRQIRKYFGSRRSGRIVLSRLIKSVIWQAYQRIQSGQERFIFTNIRSFWYRWMKPAFSRVPQRERGKRDAYDLMSRFFREMVLDLKLFSYADFDFTDENWDYRVIGEERADMLVFAEKRGWIRFLRQLNQDYDVSISCLGGFPSSLTTEYTVRALKTVLGKDRPLRLIGIVDFDPSGDLIAESFQEQLEKLEQKVSSLETIVHPRHYTKEELSLYRVDLPSSQPVKTSKWLEKTGGIDGDAWGLESESMPFDRMKELVGKMILTG